jgi:thioredoxin reductase (NADPH)
VITSTDLAEIPLFAGVEEAERQRLARKAADIRLAPGEFLIREGEEPRFFVIFAGELEVLKNIVGEFRDLGRSVAGEFSGETPIFMGVPQIVSLRALTPVRAARFERQQLQELVRDSPSAAEIVFSTMSTRTHMAQDLARAAPSSRAYVIGSKYDATCRAIRAFLSANRIQYNWRPTFDEPDKATLTVEIDHGKPLVNPTVRQVAEGLGYRTVPQHQRYDVVIVGAGPAGMAAAVYGASEGLRVLVVERFAAGGQAGTSSRIENYLGFPSGISGDELTERALKQANQFGAEIVVRRNIEALQSAERGYSVRLDGGDSIEASAILLATGVDWHRMDNVPGMEDLQGRGILYGASRHEVYGVAGKRVFIVGGGNSAGQAAVFFAGYAAEVVMLVRGAGLTLSMSRYLIDQIGARTNIKIEPYTQVTSVEGENYIERIVSTRRPPGAEESTQIRDAGGLFLMIGATANTGWLPQQLERDSKGYVCTGRDLTTWPVDREPFALETSLPGVFCAGDVRHGSIKRVASGVGEGSMSISFIHEYLALEDEHSLAPWPADL